VKRPEVVFRVPASPGMVRPEAAMDPYLDAFGRVALRFGVRRTRVQDVAREARVDRTTVFRNVGSMDDVLRLYIVREVHRFLDTTLASIPVGLDGPPLVVEVIARSIELAHAHPVLNKAIEDEPELVAALITDRLAPVLDQIVAVLAPGLALLSSFGTVAPVDADALSQWIARFGLSTVLVRPPGDLRATLATVLVPVLTPHST